MSRNQVLDVLGLEPNKFNNELISSLVSQFNFLIGDGYDASNIWLKADYNVYAFGDVIAKTRDLIVVV